MINKKRNLCVNDYNGKYIIESFQVCPFERISLNNSNWLHPLRNGGYPYILCVFDPKRKMVVSVDTEYAYEYIPMVSGYMLYKQEVLEGKRYAIIPIYVSHNDLTKEQIIKINSITKRLEEEYEFINGNDILDNSQYKMQCQKIYGDEKGPKILSKYKNRG